MSVPPHSIKPRPAAAERLTFTERNNFLYLLLGLIATSEGVLRLVPGLAPDTSRIAEPQSAAKTEPEHPQSVFR